MQDVQAHHRAITRLQSLAALMGIYLLWQAAAWGAASALLPGPLQVVSFLIEEIRNGDIIYHFAITLARVAIAFVIAMAAGGTIGFLMGRSATTNRLLDPVLITLLNIPALITILLAYVWFGLNEAAAIGAVVFNKIPNVAVTLREGTRALSPAIEDVASIYRFSRLDRLRHVVLPQLYPYIAAAARTGLALIWKIVLVVELLGRPSGVGFQLHLYFQLFDITALLAYTLAFVGLMLAIEFLMVHPLERYATRWRGVRPQYQH